MAVAVMAPTLIAPAIPLSAAATPEATPADGCAFDPIGIELPREIRDDVAVNPLPIPTTAADGYSSSRTHLIQFPPPAGEPIDEETVDSIRLFLGDYGACIGAGTLLDVYGAWTEPHLRRFIGPKLEFVEALITAAETQQDLLGYPPLDLLLLRAWRIDSDHVVAVVQLVGVTDSWSWIMLLLPPGGSWLIDDLWSVPLRTLEDSLTGPVYATPIAAD